MNRRWGDDVTAIAAQVDPLRQPGAIPGEPTGVSKIEVASAATGDRLHVAGSGLNLCSNRLSVASPPCFGSTSRTIRFEISPVTIPTLASGQRRNHSAMSSSEGRSFCRISQWMRGRLSRSRKVEPTIRELNSAWLPRPRPYVRPPRLSFPSSWFSPLSLFEERESICASDLIKSDVAAPPTGGHVSMGDRRPRRCALQGLRDLRTHGRHRPARAPLGRTLQIRGQSPGHGRGVPLACPRRCRQQP